MAMVETNNGDSKFPPQWWSDAADPGKNPPALTAERQQVVAAVQQTIKLLTAEWKQVDSKLRR